MLNSKHVIAKYKFTDVHFSNVTLFQEMSMMKQVVLSLHQQQGLHPKTSKGSLLKSPRSPKSLSLYSGKSKMQKVPIQHHFEPAERDENIHKPAPTEFVRICLL